MSYTSNVPVTGQSLNASRDIINENFTILGPYGNGFSFFTVQLAAPSFSANTDYLYMKAFASANEMFIHKQTTSGLSEVPFTASKMSLSVAADCDKGWAYLPCGSLIKWGNVTATTAAIFTVDVASLSGGPVYSRVLQTYLTPYWGGSVTNSASVPFFTGTATVDGNFNCFVSNYVPTNSKLSYLIIGI